jgi:hypothetical protein
MLRALAVVAAALVVCAPVFARSGPTMRMTVAAPATVQGAGFQPRETVRLVLRAGGKTQAHRLLTTPSGRFSSIWKSVAVDLCSAWSLTATGSKGSRVALHSRANACPAPSPFE